MLRRVHEEKAVGLFYGQRALCIGAVKPLNYVGTTAHTRHRSTPFRRIAHTGEMFERVFFGTRAEADQVLAATRRMHEDVVGELDRDTGVHPAGTPYSAFDPELMLWTIAVIADSAQWFYERLVQPLTAAELEALWRDYLHLGELFEMPREFAPPTHEGFRAWYSDQLEDEDLYLTAEARYMGYVSAFEIPMPVQYQLGKRLHDLIMLGSIPPRVRDLYGLSFNAAQAAACVAALTAGRSMRRLLPGGLARGSCIPEFRMVAAVERRRIARGQPTPRLADQARPGVAARNLRASGTLL
jgi:uncharacterized protein (DUF2236 family)